ncbi:MAG: hypothetical protein AB9866_09505 [Syntrophobacteraceae bacterium]
MFRVISILQGKDPISFVTGGFSFIHVCNSVEKRIRIYYGAYDRVLGKILYHRYLTCFHLESDDLEIPQTPKQIGLTRVPAQLAGGGPLFQSYGPHQIAGLIVRHRLCAINHRIAAHKIAQKDFGLIAIERVSARILIPEVISLCNPALNRPEVKIEP